MNKYFYILSLTLLIFSCGKEAENFRPTTKLKTILENEKLNKTYRELIMRASLQSGLENVKSFEKFVAETNVGELILFTECDQPVMRCFAFKALISKDYPEIRKVFIRHKNDNEIIQEKNGCILWKIPVKEFMLRQLDPFSKTEYRFNRKEYDEWKRIL